MPVSEARFYQKAVIDPARSSPPSGGLNAAIKTRTI
jgi:hypothetical protein